MLQDYSQLNLRHLQAMLAVRENGSVSAAAQRIGLSQPALTQAVLKLEQQFGHTLFERRSDGMLTTPVGEQVAERVHAALGHLAHGTRALSYGTAAPERRMTLTQLRAFLALVDAGSFAAAATATGMSRTAAHRAVGDLEEAAGEILVDRRGRGICLNSAGRRLARGTRLAVAELTAVLVELGLHPEGTLIGLGVTPTARALVVPEAMAHMATETDTASFRIYEGSWAELVEPLRDGVIDLIVGEVGNDEISDLAQKPLYEDRLIIVGGSRHPLAGNACVSVDALCAHPWIVGLPNSPLRNAWEELFAGRALPRSPVECDSVMINGRLLTSGDFLTLMNPDQAALPIRSGLLAQIGAPLSHATSTIGLTVRRNWRPTKVQQRFLCVLQKVSSHSDSDISRRKRLVGDWI